MYQSIDEIQKALSENIFGYTGDKKKAAGRALGTFLEIITWYLIKAWGLEKFTAIERPLFEYANSDIAHNVEFTMHPSAQLYCGDYNIDKIPLKSRTIANCLNRDILLKSANVIDKDGTIKNACTIGSDEKSFINVYTDTNKSIYSVHSLLRTPFAMFECKRVGVEEGMKKGPQTIEKAKQGSYVARSVSSLQKMRNNDGSLGGVIQKKDGTYLLGNYCDLLHSVINGDNAELLRNFILTVGIVSNHGNWFTQDNLNKELKVLSQSYDWLLFLTDEGIVQFVTDLLIERNSKYAAVKEAFLSSYSLNKKANVFTKVRMNYKSDEALCEYFSVNIKTIEKWFNVISPKESTLLDLKANLINLSRKDWWEVYK